MSERVPVYSGGNRHIENQIGILHLDYDVDAEIFKDRVFYPEIWIDGLNHATGERKTRLMALELGPLRR